MGRVRRKRRMMVMERDGMMSVGKVRIMRAV